MYFVYFSLFVQSDEDNKFFTNAGYHINAFVYLILRYILGIYDEILSHVMLIRLRTNKKVHPKNSAKHSWLNNDWKHEQKSNK